MDDLMLVTGSLERLAETGTDITPQVYQRFFALCPAAEPLFASTEARSVQGKMINELVQTVLDQLENQPYSQTVMETMANDHEGWGVTLPMYQVFLDAFLQVLAETLGATKESAAMAAWQRQFDQILQRVEAVLVGGI